MKQLINSFLLLVTIIGLCACSDSLLTESPPDILGPDALYKDYAGFQAGVNGLYSQIARERSGSTYGSGNGLLSEIMNSGTDIMYSNQRANVGQVMNQWQERNTSDFGQYNRVWEWLYATINGANTIVDRAENPGIDWTDVQKNRILAEARCIRALAYRHLTYLFGDVPLTLHESTGSNIKFDFTRTSVDSVRAQMEKDWLFAKQNLPETPDQPGKLVKGVAQHYLAELYLAEGRNQDAENEAQDLVNNGPFSLVTQRYGVEANEPGTPFTDMFIDGNSNFSEGNTEAIWTFQNEYQVPGGDNSNIMRRWYVNRYYQLVSVTVDRGGRGIGRVGPTNFALKLYKKGDDRGSKFAWRYFYIYRAGVDDIPSGKSAGDTVSVYEDRDEKIRDTYWPSTRKWDSAQPDALTDPRQYDDQVYLRLANTYLLLAEAQYKLGQPGTAATTINKLRARAHTSLITASDVDMNFILDERSRELWSEGQRRYTLLRTGKWIERTRLHNKVAGPYVTDRDKLYPIPQAVIDANNQGGLTQNPGY